VPQRGTSGRLGGLYDGKTFRKLNEEQHSMRNIPVNIFRLLPVADDAHPRWGNAQNQGEVVIRAVSPADARVVASEAEVDFLDVKAVPADGNSTRRKVLFVMTSFIPSWSLHRFLMPLLETGRYSKAISDRSFFPAALRIMADVRRLKCCGFRKVEHVR
jgi:hypothetical protein